MVLSMRRERASDLGEAFVSVLDQTHQPGNRPRVALPGSGHERGHIPGTPHSGHAALPSRATVMLPRVP